MDQHPIPQDVTGFQFKLIGTMTVKQFGFVAIGVVTAFILYYIPIKGALGFLIKFFLIPTLGGSGFIVAFVPIEGRPIDVMTTNFVKAVLAPNQYIYRKVGRRYRFSEITLSKPPTPEAIAAAESAPKTVSSIQMREISRKNAQLEAYLRSSQKQVKNDLDEKEMAFLHTVIKASTPATPAPAIATPASAAAPVMPASIGAASLTSAFHTAPAPAAAIHPSAPQPAMIQKPATLPPTAAPTAPSPMPLPPKPNQEQPVSASLQQQENMIEHELEEAKKAEANSQAPESLSAAHQKVMTLEKQLLDIHSKKQQLEQELQRLKTQMPASPLQQSAPAAPAPAPAATTALAIAAAPAAPTPSAPAAAPNVRNITQDAGKNAGLPHISDTPNVVVGIVKDPRGNILPNMLVEVKDKEGNPVRAFKTNALGQFASATPLANDTYTIELDDPKKQHTFDVIQIVANGQIMLPIEIISHDAREELRKQLFN